MVYTVSEMCKQMPALSFRQPGQTKHGDWILLQGYPPFLQGEDFCDFLLAFLYTKLLLKIGPLYKGQILPLEQILWF